MVRASASFIAQAVSRDVENQACCTMRIVGKRMWSYPFRLHYLKLVIVNKSQNGKEKYKTLNISSFSSKY